MHLQVASGTTVARRCRLLLWTAPHLIPGICHSFCSFSPSVVWDGRSDHQDDSHQCPYPPHSQRIASSQACTGVRASCRGDGDPWSSWLSCRAETALVVVRDSNARETTPPGQRSPTRPESRLELSNRCSTRPACMWRFTGFHYLALGKRTVSGSCAIG